MNINVVTASEIAEFTFCKEALRLRLADAPNANQPQLTAGTAEHADKAVAERIAGGSIAFGRLLIVIAILAMLAALLWR